MKPHNYAIIFIPFVLILSNFAFLLFNTGFYYKEFEKTGVYEGLDKETVQKETKLIVSYFIGSEETLHTTFFNAKERIHMLEVKEIIRKVLFLWVSSIVLLVISLFFHPNYSKVFFYGGIITMGLLLLLSLIFINFSSSFLDFHETFFRDKTWILNPEKDNLVKMFPEQFFRDFLKKLIFNSFITSFVVVAVPVYLKKFKNKTSKR